MINNLIVTKEEDAFEYQSGVLTHKILDLFGETPITDIYFDKPKLTTAVMNETFATFAGLNIPEKGLDRLLLSCFMPDTQELLSESVLQSFAAKCKSLKILEICWMKAYDLPWPVHLQVIHLIAFIIENQTGSDMEYFRITKSSRAGAE